MNPSREITVPELAKRLGCTIPHAQYLIRTQRLPGRKSSRGWVTTEAALEKYLKDRRSNLRQGGIAQAA